MNQKRVWSYLKSQTDILRNTFKLNATLTMLIDKKIREFGEKLTLWRQSDLQQGTFLNLLNILKYALRRWYSSLYTICDNLSYKCNNLIRRIRRCL